MKRLTLAAAALCAASAVLGAQSPGSRMSPGPMPGPGGIGQHGAGAVDDPAQFLLAHTGELKLTDAQVTRLAAIARRSADRRRSLRSQMDSLRPQFAPGGQRPDSAARAQMRQRFEQMRPAMDRLREQSQADRRDAIAVLTPDQQAQAWERIAAGVRMQRGRGMNRGFGRGFAPRGGVGRGMPRGGRNGQRMAPRRMGPPNDDRQQTP